jgi:hypothetical protein
MKTSVIRRIVFCLIALWAFGQAAVALAACSMERGAPMTSQADGMPDCGSGAQICLESANVCVAHCNADLQLTSEAPVLVRAPADTPVLMVVRFQRHPIESTALEAPPPRALPPRILQHAFLI